MTWMKETNTVHYIFLLLCVLPVSARAELLVDGSVTGTATASASDISGSIRPILSLAYNTPRLSLNTDWATRLLSGLDWLNDSQWQTDNRLRWRAPGERFSASLQYQHDESEADSNRNRQIRDVWRIDSSIAIPQSRTLQHRWQLAAIDQSLDNQLLEEQVSDQILNGSYQAIWLASAAQRWQFGGSYRWLASGSNVSDVSVDWQLATNRSVINLGTSANLTVQDNNRNTLVAGEMGYRFEASVFTLLFGASRRQTDALNLFDVLFLNSPVTVQTQVTVDEITVDLTQIQLSNNTRLDGSYLVGKTGSVTEVSALGGQDNYSVEYQQAGLSVTAFLTDSSQINLSWQTRRENDISEQRLDLTGQWQINTHWQTTLNLRHSSAESANLAGSFSVTYQM